MGAAIEMGDESPEVLESADPVEAKQEYEGDDIGALATAKQRMAERDAEYSAAFAKSAAANDPKPAAKRAASKPAVKAASKETPPYAEDAPAVDKGKTETKMADVKGGLRGLKGGTTIPSEKQDRAEYLKAWKKA